jgi:Fe-S cluster assembly iron-binding protein IscA
MECADQFVIDNWHPIINMSLRRRNSKGPSPCSASLDEVPEDCGYMKKFRYNIDMNSNGIMGDCIEWCQVNCEGRWGWWFEPVGEIDEPQEPLGGPERLHELPEEKRRPDSGWPWESRTWATGKIITSMSLFEITDAAKQQMERLLAKNPDKWAVSLRCWVEAVRDSSTNGDSLTTKKACAEGDHVEDWGTGRFVVDETSMLYVAGTKWTGWRRPLDHSSR